MAATEPNAPASMVLTAMIPIRRLPFIDAPSVLPGLKPNQPKARMKQPSKASTMLWPGMVFALPSRLYLPRREPNTMAPASAHQPPTACTTPLPAKSMYPLPRPTAPNCESQPPPPAPLPQTAQTSVETKSEYTQKADHFQRSAIAPLGLVAVVSINTISNRNITAI